MQNSLSRPPVLAVFSQDKNIFSGHSNQRRVSKRCPWSCKKGSLGKARRDGVKPGRTEAERRMTEKEWERFELTGAVVDYLRYKGIDWRETAQARAADFAADGPEQSAAEWKTNRRMKGYGTDDHGDGHGAGGQSLR